ncbi:MAG: hypothetical protein WA853_07100 [Candidatus Acidiferrum sp.]
MANNAEAWLKQAKAFLTNPAGERQIIPFAISMLATLYGPHSAQLAALNRRLEECVKRKEGFQRIPDFQAEQAYFAIQSAVTEIENGLIVNLRAQIAGEVLADLIGMAKEILANQSESAKDVAAVLVAAAFEDVIRRMGSELAGVTGRPKLEEIINNLKDANILKGGGPAVTQSYLKFRNDSLHADWANIERSQIHSCLAFMESLLVKHFN